MTMENPSNANDLKTIYTMCSIHGTTQMSFTSLIFKKNLLPSELTAQQKIYNIYQNTIHNTPEHCGCGTAAEIAYMGHNTGYFEFQYIQERESYEVLLVISRIIYQW